MKRKPAQTSYLPLRYQIITLRLKIFGVAVNDGFQPVVILKWADINLNNSHTPQTPSGGLFQHTGLHALAFRSAPGVMIFLWFSDSSLHILFLQVSIFRRRRDSSPLFGRRAG